MQRLVVRRIRTIGGALLSLVLVGSLSACYGPDQTMMVVHRASDGSLTFTVPICQGGAPNSVSIGAIGLESGQLGYRHPAGESWSDEDLVFVVSDQSVRNGHLADFGLQQDSTWAVDSIESVADLNWVLVATDRGEVSVDPRVFSNASDADWVVRGILHEGDSPGPAVSPEQAKDALAEYCE